MKKLILFLVMACSFAGKAQFIKAELQASGLTCSMCSFATQKQLKTLSFIDSIGTDLNNTTFILYFKKDSPIDLDRIKKKVEDAGFFVASLKVTYHFDNLQIENDFHFDYQSNLYHFMNVKPQTLSGNRLLRVIDKGFVTDKEYKKYSKETTLPCYKTGKMPEVNRVYHVTLL